ncbi:MAG TPA: hypothetical protein VFY29_00065 [Terriglobia bacterium]|nr:hypothetical protein [Terriglobia bacterium]
MKRLPLTVICLTLALSAAPAFADTLILKSGDRISGYFEGGTARVLKFRASDGIIRDYDIVTVERLQFGDDVKPAVAAAPAPINPAPIAAPIAAPTPAPTVRPAATPAPTAPPAPVAPPQLLANQPAGTGQAARAASTPKFTLPTGSTITIRMVDSVSSEKQKMGDEFLAVLDDAIVQDGVELVPRGVDVRGRIAAVNEAGRVAGAAQLSLELTQILINGVNYALNTSEYSEVAESRGPQTGRRAVGGAGLGAIIGAIAGGGRGAAVGAGIGAGAGVASTVLTKGEKLNVPPETRLQFTLRSPLVVGEK